MFIVSKDGDNVKRVVTTIFSLLLVLPLLLAAGGGGGGGGGSGGSISPYSDLKCTDTGVLSFTRGAVWDEVIAEDPNGNKIVLPGSWSKQKFDSDEAFLIKAGKYVVKDPKYGNKEVNCPGLSFSCTLMTLQLQECQQVQGKVKVRFALEGIGAFPDDMGYQFKQQDSSRIFKRSKTSISSELKNFQITKNFSGTFVLETELLPMIETVQVSHPRCVGEYYTYSKIACKEGEKVGGEKVGKTVFAVEESGQKKKKRGGLCLCVVS